MEPEAIDDDNLYRRNDGSKEGPTLEEDSVKKEKGLYVNTVKPIFDQIISFSGLVLLAPLYGVIGLAVYLDDPGPVLFTQKRVGKDKHYIRVHKFRSMKMNTPHDVPTHQLSEADQYITRVGRVLRKTSLDELPQLWDIFRGRMSVIGPRPALWNQKDLVAERDKYGANSVLPGLTGLAQISGRDKLEIPEKAELDGKYIESLESSGMDAFLMDCKCFFKTIKSVISYDGVVEGGTGRINRISAPMADEAVFGDYGYLNIDRAAAKKS